MYTKIKTKNRKRRTIDALRTASNADRWVEVDGIRKMTLDGLSVCMGMS